MASSADETTTTTADIDIATNVADVYKTIRTVQSPDTPVRLVAVSKTKPVALLERAYTEANVRIMGENYVQELAEKVPQLPGDVTWHFIGHLQSNKVNLLLSPFVEKADFERLVVETVSSIKLANKLNKAVETAVASVESSSARLAVFIQVNTSGEDSKSGVSFVNDNAEDVITLCRTIVDECPALELRGLMTIGAPGDEACLDALVTCRGQVQEALGLTEPLELSMGMSGDYAVAIQKGSTNVRVGSTIFGARAYPPKTS